MTVSQLADSVLSSPLAVAAVAGLLGGGGLGAVVALLRVGPDRNAVVIKAAQGAVIVQTSVIDDLQEELNRVKTVLAELRAQLADEVEAGRLLRQRLATVERQTNGRG